MEEERIKLEFFVFETQIADVGRISVRAGRPFEETARLLLKSGIRMFFRDGRLSCGYQGCTRKGCCAGESKEGRVISFDVLKGGASE